MTPDDIDGQGAVDMEEIMSALFKHGSAIFNTRHVSKEGQKIPTEINARLFDLKGGKAVLSVARNVTTQDKILEDLKNSELRSRKSEIGKNRASRIAQ